MNRPTIQLFINPRRGWRFRARTRTLCSALTSLGADIIVEDSISARLVIDERADHVCSVGGDGTLRHVVEAVRRAERPISISAYPAGTVNLLAMECDYSRDPYVFARRALEAAMQRPHYFALIGQVPLLTCASVGPDSYAIAELSPRMKRLIGRAAYLVAFCKLLTRWRRIKLSLLHDGHRTECEAAYVAKGRFFAGRWSFAPDARVSNPLLHVTTLQEATRAHFIRFAWALLRRRPVEGLGGVQGFTCTELTMLSDEAPPLQGDGDIIARLPLSIRLDTDALRFA